LTLLLGIDVGSSRLKALLVDAHGEEVASSAVKTPFRQEDDGIEMTVEALRNSLQTALERLGGDRSRVAAVGIAGMAECGAPLNREGQPLAPVIAWHDRRGEDVAERLTARFGDGLARRIGQPLRYVSSVAKLGWLLEHGVSDVARWLGAPELCLAALCDEHVTVSSLAARTGCWDLARRTWLPEVADAAGFSTIVFPPVADAGEPMGRVTAQAATWSGVPVGSVVTLAGHDHLAGFVGSGAGPDDLVNSVGTAETVVGRASEMPDVDAALDGGVAVTIFPGRADDGWAVLASAARAGIALEEAAARLGSSPSELDELATGAPVLEAPGLLESLRERRPPVLPEGSPGAAWNTLLHALATFTGEAVEDVTRLLGSRQRLVVFGGAAASKPWLAAKAALVGVPVSRSTATEAVARGAAVFAGVAAGWWPSVAAAPTPDVAPVEGRPASGPW
jgi:xylulokinase